MALDPKFVAALSEQRSEAVNDYIESLPDSQSEIEHFTTLLIRSPGDKNLINGLFRAIHSVKSNAAMCQLNELVRFAHPLEDVVGEIRAGKLPFNSLLAEVILLGFDWLKHAAQTMSHGRPLDTLGLEDIAKQFRTLAQASPDQADRIARGVIGTITGEVMADPAAQAVNVQPAVRAEQSDSRLVDLKLFYAIITQLERRSPYWEGRTDRILKLALDTNHVAGNVIDTIQLEAAVLMHDVGMAFLPESLWTKEGRYNELELREMRSHTSLAAALLQRIPGWAGAVIMVAQHHERVDGNGYPQGLAGDQISDGAKLLAIIDAFEAMTHERGDRNYKRSVLRAITEINASENQFDKRWVQFFNRVVKKLLEQQAQLEQQMNA
jgi:HPt (histidine-containing phosphotransfer) domain-containing protein